MTDCLIEENQLTNSEEIEVRCVTCDWKYVVASPLFVPAIVSRHKTFGVKKGA